MPDDIFHYDQSTWMAKRVADAVVLDSPQLPQLVALPGAKVAIPHDRLAAYQGAGLGEEGIRSRVNARWRQEAATRLSGHAAWVAGPYQERVDAGDS